MKAIDKICSDLNEKAYYKKLTFRHAAAGVTDKRKGYAIYMPSVFDDTKFSEVVTIEPCHYSNGDKWKIYGSLVRGYSTLFYAKNIPQVRKRILAVLNGKKDYYDQF